MKKIALELVLTLSETITEQEVENLRADINTFLMLHEKVAGFLSDQKEILNVRVALKEKW